IEQRLDLWSGLLTSRFTVTGKPVTVRTAVHPDVDLLAVAVETPLIGDGRVGVRFVFPYGDPGMQAADWEKPERHRSKLVAQTANRANLRRTLDEDEYSVAITWHGAGSFLTDRPHTFLLVPGHQESRLEFVSAFAQRDLPESLPTVAETFAASAEHWRQFWTRGGAIELAQSRDPRAPELERRIVLSQY